MPSGSINSSRLETSRGFPWRVFWLLLLASLAGAAAATPLLLEILQPIIQNAPPLTIPLPLLVAIGITQNALLLALAIGLGLWLGRKINLGAPLLESGLYHASPKVSARGALKAGALVGITVGIVITIVIIPAAPHLPGLPFVTASHAAVWKRVLACFYGGIVEEIFTRLFLLTLIAWLGSRIFQKEKGRLTPGVFWAANIIVAILFGLGHLPSASMVMPITPTVVILALALNGIAAIPFGYLYWKRGLEAAMFAHFCADFMVYVIGAALLKT